jgi:hypothetical protein
MQAMNSSGASVKLKWIAGGILPAGKELFF